MPFSIEPTLHQLVMGRFYGLQAPPEFLAALRKTSLGGVTLYRSLNVDHPAQVRELAASLQRAAGEGGSPPLLVAADQEGGQLLALGEGPTAFPGNLALGAAGSPELAQRVGYALGQELAAMGINVNYAPVCDVNSNPRNPVVGTRSFGEDPVQVARLAAALIQGLQAAGVAATAKHFPGHGDTSTDSHYATPVVPYDAERLRQVELPPFVAAISAGVKLVMTAHLALPAFNGGRAVPSTFSRAVLSDLLRGELGFRGPIITDAMDMQAIRLEGGPQSEAEQALGAGVDLLLLNQDLPGTEKVIEALMEAVRQGRLHEHDLRVSAGRVLALKNWLAHAWVQPPLEVVGCAEHLALALEVASRAITCVRDETHFLPLRLSSEEPLAVILPTPADLTPADTSSYTLPSLAQPLRRYHSAIDEFLMPLNPTSTDVGALRERCEPYSGVVVGTINAGLYPGQAALVNALLDSGVKTIAVALRMPYDLLAYPAAPTYLCTYSILPPAMEALAGVLWGEIPCQGRLPVTIPGLVARPEAGS